MIEQLRRSPHKLYKCTVYLKVIKRKEISSKSHKTLGKHDLTQKIRCQIRLMQVRDLIHFQNLLIISSE